MDEPGHTNRRQFLSLMSLAVAPVVSSAADAAPAAAPEGIQSTPYRETDHVRTAYTRMRF